LDYFIGEALVGEGAEVAHIDLIIGDKESPVGQAFAAGLTNVSAGHTPLLAVIRPNLPPKPFTLIVPKVTIEESTQVEKVFGPAQAAVAKAVADAVEEGVIPAEKVEDWVILCSVFVHPEAQDLRKIYHYNYGATKLALKRALAGYPPLEKIMYDKDRAKHPIMGFRVPRLWMPPYLQVALDIPDLERTKTILAELPLSDRLILEAGTPLIKRYGAKVIRAIKEIAKETFVVADFKTLDVGQVEVNLAFDETADGVVASGLASNETLNLFIYEAARLGIYSFIDMMNVPHPVEKIKALKEPPDVVILHESIDVGRGEKTRWDQIAEIKEAPKGKKKLLVGVAGGIRPSNVHQAVQAGADIIVVGRYITQSKDPKRSAREFLSLLGEDMDLYRVHVE
jgi:bifunctional enzyme Fae/Hps